MADMLDSEEAARHLGVKLSTLYAYVSRGVLVSHPVPGTRRRRFARADLDRLARRARPAGADDTRVATVITGITQIDHDGPRYRGQRLDALARHGTFEAAAELLWAQGEGDGEWWQPRRLPVSAVAAMSHLPDGEVLRLAVVVAGAADPFRGDRRPDAQARAASRLIATVVEALPERAPGVAAAPGRAGGDPAPAAGRSGAIAARDPAPAAGRPGAIAARLAAALATRKPTPATVRAVDAALVLMADHELATSTLAARVAASARADLYNVVLAGLGAMSGRLHAGAANQVRPLLDDARWQGPEAALGRVLRERPVPDGFGHPLYVEGDPRAGWLLEWVRPVATAERWSLVERVLAVARAQGVPPPNVDFALGALAWVAGWVPEAPVTLATVARLAGWVAHALEEYEEAPLRFRARAVYRAAD